MLSVRHFLVLRLSSRCMKSQYMLYPGTATKALDIYNRFADTGMVQSCNESSRCIHCHVCSSPSVKNKTGNNNFSKSNGEASTEHKHIKTESEASDGKSSSKKRKIDKTVIETNGNINENNQNNTAKDKGTEGNDHRNNNSGKKRSRCTSSCSFSLLQNLRPFNRIQDWHVIDGPGPVVLFATPANLSTGISRQVFQAWCSHPGNLIVMPSASVATSVAPNSNKGTSGYTNSPQVRCQIVNSLSACHPDSSDLLRICRHIEPKSVMLVHGEQTKVLAFQKCVEKILGVPCFTANGDTIVVPQHTLSQPSAVEALSIGNGSEGEEDEKRRNRPKVKFELPNAFLQIAKKHDISLSLNLTPTPSG